MDNLNAEPFRQKFRAIPPNTHTQKNNPKTHKHNENIKHSNLNNFLVFFFSVMFAKFQFDVDYNGHTVLQSLKKCNWSLATMTRTAVVFYDNSWEQSSSLQ